MDEDALTVTAVRDGPVCALILSGDLDLSGTGWFLEKAALAIGDRTERLVLDLGGVTFLDCAGVRALAMAASLAPGGCPVIMRSVSPMARRILTLLDLDVENPRQAWPWASPHQLDLGSAASQQEPSPTGAEACPRPTGGDPDG